MMASLALLVTLAGLGVSYLFVRERFSAGAALFATIAIAAGSMVAWQITSPAPWPAALALAAGAILALAASQLAGSGSPARRFAIAVVLGGAAAAPWLGTPVRWSSPAIADVLWSSRGGVLATSPMIVFALAGLAWLGRLRDAHGRARAAAGLALFALVTLFVAARRTWWIDAAPGPLPYITLVPYLAAGAAAGFDALAAFVARRPGRAVGAVLALLVLWNIGLVGLGQRGDYRLGEPQSFAALDAAEARTWHGWIGHPPSYPGNLISALWNGVSPARIDLLSANRLLPGGAAEGSLDVGTNDDWFIGAGWHARELEGDRSFRWATSEASLDLPLDHRADLTLLLTLRPFDLPPDSPQRLEISMNGHQQPPVVLASGWQDVRINIPRAAWRTGVNRLILKFAAQRRPSDAGNGGDTRWLAAAVDKVSVF